MANRVRGIEVIREKSGTHLSWHWTLGGVRWDYRHEPTRGLYRRGVSVSEGLASKLCCVDDAVLVCLGMLEGMLWALGEEK